MTVDTDYGKYPENFAKYVRATTLCDFDVAPVRKLANTIKKENKTALKAISAAWESVAKFPEGFDQEDKSASYILKKGRGQCNTKTTLLVTLLRAMGIPARVHVWRIYKVAHKGHMNGFVHFFAPKTTIFTYPEVFYKNKWQLLSEVVGKKDAMNEDACPFDDAQNRKFPLKKEWIAQDLGSMWHPDDVWQKFGTNASGWRRLAFPFAQLLLNK